MSFERVPVDGSSKMADDIMESIEPYDFSAAVDFNTAYLAGYLADKYDVDAQQSMKRASERIKCSTEIAFKDSVRGYATVLSDGGSVRFSGSQVRYVFAMNGQTGKFTGDLPVDKRAYMRWLFGLGAAFSAAAFAITFIMWLI